MQTKWVFGPLWGGGGGGGVTAGDKTEVSFTLMTCIHDYCNVGCHSCAMVNNF